MNNKNYSAEQLSFWQLIQKTAIEIPIIQRDYAQGRESKKKIRENFLHSLKEAINGKHVELDFIYGTRKNRTLQPLDGQQRLTTLFLLHWYFAAKENALTPDVQEKLSNFTYETRISSRRFCNALISKSISFNKLLPADKDKENSLSNTIIDAPWFSLSWKNDPTIKAMLTMLDSIHRIYFDVDSGWGTLTGEQTRPITFQYVELTDLGLTDDLYIKMNARGKQLSPFENFKAVFEKKIEDEKWEDGLPITEKFSHKVDTTWTDIFWNSSKPNNFDNAYIRFIANAALVSIALKPVISNDKRERGQQIQELFNNAENLNPNHIDVEAYHYLYKSLEAYTKTDTKSITLELPIWHHLKKGENLFERITLDKAPTYPQRILFLAQTEFLIKGGAPSSVAFNNWMRVIRNIVLNANIDSAETFAGATSLIVELSKGSQDIYAYLASQDIKSGFASAQIKEEVIKAKLIQANLDNAPAIFETEDKSFCRGKIAFALYCIDYLKEGDYFDRNLLSAINKVIAEHLEKEDISNQFRRALLTIKDNNFYSYWRSWLYAVDSEKRKLIADTEDLRYFANKPEYREYLKILLKQLIDKQIEALLKDFQPTDTMPNWKKRLISEPDLLEHSQQHYIAIPTDESCCYLIPQSKVANTKKGEKKLRKIT